ncbi:MAG: hypothetical protein U0163_07855 [Gemmatimonadaceae bacterium]
MKRNALTNPDRTEPASSGDRGAYGLRGFRSLNAMVEGLHPLGLQRTYRQVQFSPPIAPVVGPLRLARLSPQYLGSFPLFPRSSMQKARPQYFKAAGVVMIALAVVHTPLKAQQPVANTRSYVQVYRLKPDMVNEWLDLQRTEVVPAQKKAGVTSRTTLVTQVGNSFEYQILTPFPSWSAMDGDTPLVRALGAEGAAQLNAKLRKCILLQQTYMTNRVDSLTIPAPDALVWRTVVRRVNPGR